METETDSKKRKNDGKCLGKNHYTNNATVRTLRNQAEKQRRDRLNDQIAQLAALVPPAVNATKPLDKVSILRLSASWMRLNYSCLNAKRFKSAVANYLDMHHSLVSNLDILEKSINGFIIATTFSGVVLMCSRYAEEYIGYQNIDLLGHHISNFVLPKEKDLLMKKIRNLISKYKNGSSSPRNVIRVRMQQRPLPRSNEMRYRKMSFSLSIHTGDEPPQNTVNLKKSLKIGRHKDFGESAVILIFAEPAQLEPNIDVQYLEEKDCYFTLHGTQGEIIFADHRISFMTGYMPRDVLGNSAYQYIHSSDVPIALFAQKAMFASSDGTGIITYRLRIRDTSYIYLQTKGQIRYKDSSKEVRQFICCNMLLSEEDGRRELKKFQERYAPQLDASKRNCKEIKSSTATSAEAITSPATKSQPFSFEQENLKDSNRLSESNSSITDTPMEIEEPNRNGDYSLSVKSIMMPLTSDPLESFMSNGFHLACQAVPPNNSNETITSEILSCNVQSNNKFSTFNNISPLLSASSLDEASDSFAESVIHTSDDFSAPRNSIESSIVTSDLLLIPDDFTPYNTSNEKNFFLPQKHFSSQDIPHQKIFISQNNHTPDDIQANAGSFSNDMDPENFFIPQNAFQNHETISSLIIPDETPQHFENGHKNINNHVSHNYFSNFSRKNTYMSDGQSPLNKSGVANKTFSENSCHANLDLSFLDRTVDSMALLSDLSDLYENSTSVQKTNSEVNSLHDAVENGANSQEANMLGLHAQISSNSHISNKAHLSQFSDYSPDSYFTSDRYGLTQTNGITMHSLNGANFKAPELKHKYEWHANNAKIHCSSAKQSSNGYIHSQLQAKAAINNVSREGDSSSKNRMNHLHPCTDSSSAFFNHAQNGHAVVDDVIGMSNTSLFSFDQV